MGLRRWCLVYAVLAFAWLIYVQAILALILVRLPYYWSEVDDEGLAGFDKWVYWDGSWLALIWFGLAVIAGVALLVALVLNWQKLDTVDLRISGLCLVAGLVCVGAAWISENWINPDYFISVSEKIQRLAVAGAVDVIMAAAFVLRIRRIRSQGPARSAEAGP